MPCYERAAGVVCVYADYEALSRAAAELFLRRANEAINDHGRFIVALSGGHTPERAYELLAGPAFNSQVDWGRVHIFWGDERCVPPNDPRSNARMAREKLLDHVPVPPEQVHTIDCANSAKDCARSYESLLRSFFNGGPGHFDLIFLGLGTDGHTVSLFPGMPALREKARWVTEVYSEKDGIYRVTLTAPILNQSSVLAFIVSGDSKAEVLREVLTQRPESERFPARLIKPDSYEGKLYWLVDRNSASLLETG
ncbi:MAG: 6-phosphogluconolactonase [Syntrophobacteraceae bacterium]|jgi:6-phosphogluconolactonase